MNTTQNKIKYKNSPLGLIPEDWEVKTLGEVSNYIKGFAFNSNDYVDEGVRIIRISDTTSNSIKDNGAIYIRSEDAYKFKKWELKEHDLVFTTVGSRPPMYDSMVGKVIKINKQYEGAFLNQNAVIIRSDEKVNQEFLFNQFKKKRYLDFIETIVRGNANQVSITLDNLFSYQLSLPPLPEQTAIANCLSTWDKAIATLTQIIAQKELRKKALANRLLTGKVRLKGFEKEKWIEKKADTLFRNNTDKSHNGKLEILSASQERGIVPRSSNNIDIKYDVNSLGSYKKVEVGDYVISLRSFQGGIEYSEYEGIVSPAYTILKEIIPISKIFYKVYFKTETFINRLNTIIYGIRDGKQIGFKDFATLKLPYPSIEEQTAIANILQCADEEIQLLKKKLQQLKDQKRGLMQVLLTGRKRLEY
jgi:type I restriction enzyme S subunit